jgi:murein DD-endopeptidase MepM/ murein hydrolase activator NlpD
MKRGALIRSTCISLLGCIVTIFPQQTDAAIFSKLLNVFNDDPIVYESGEPYSSQNLPLPKSPRNIDPVGTGGADITIIGSALVSDIGPAGTITDVTEGTKHGEITVYTVEKGDTIEGIAKQFSVSKNTIRWANDLKSNTIRIGQKLVILPVTGIRYTVKRGGTVRDIVKKYGGDVDEVASYNAVDPDEELPAGAEVIVPNGEYLVETASKKPSLAKRPSPRSVGKDAPRYAGFYIHPLGGLGVRTQGLHGFNAVDIGAPVGTPVVASARGEVILSKPLSWNGGYGSYVVIKHSNGTQTLYAHLSQNAVSAGEFVEQGDLVGYSGNSGKSTGPHLHFEVRGAQNPF